MFKFLAKRNYPERILMRSRRAGFLRLHKWRHWTVERIGNGAEQLCFAFLDDAVGGDGLGASVKKIFLNLRDSLAKTPERYI